MNRIRFTKVREVRSPLRSHSGDAGLDFYIPSHLTLSDMKVCNPELKQVEYVINPDKSIKIIKIQPHSKVLIPSGIRVLLEPKNSMLMAANKSGISTQKGIIYSAEIVDSPYTGEVHIGLINTTNKVVNFDVDSKAIQFIHVPIYLSTPEEISNEAYEEEAKDWGTRGSDGFGSTDNE